MEFVTSAVISIGTPQYVNLVLGPGVHLKQISGQNVARGSLLVGLYLARQVIDHTGTVITLDQQAELLPVKSEIQGGDSSSVIWFGDIFLGVANVIVGIFENPAAGDSLLLTAGYER